MAFNEVTHMCTSEDEYWINANDREAPTCCGAYAHKNSCYCTMRFRDRVTCKECLTSDSYNNRLLRYELGGERDE